MSNNLNADRISSGQNQKYQTANDMAEALDAALTDTETLDFTSGAVTLNRTQYAAAMAFKCTNVGSALALTLFPAKKLSVVWNAGANQVNVTMGSTVIPVPAGYKVVIYTDGTANGMFSLGLSGVGGGGGIGGALAYAPSSGSVDPGAGITGFVAALGAAGTGRLKVTTSGDTTFAGLPVGVDGQELFVDFIAGGSADILSLTANGTTAGAQMLCSGGGRSIPRYDSLHLVMDGGLGKWLIVA